MLAGMRGLSGDDLLNRAVRLRGIRLGEAVDVILDDSASRVLGFDVLCGDGEHRFLPHPAAELDGDGLAVRSALTLLDAGQLAFYRERGATLLELRGDGRGDIVLGADGSVEGWIADEERSAALPGV